MRLSLFVWTGSLIWLFFLSFVSRQVYSIGDLRYVNESDLLSLGMSKPQFRKIKRHLPSSSNASLTNNTMFTSTWSKLLVRVSDRAWCKLWASTNWCSEENWALYSYNHIFPPSFPLSPFCSPRSCRYLVLVLFSDRHRITVWATVQSILAVTNKTTTSTRKKKEKKNYSSIISGNSSSSSNSGSGTSSGQRQWKTGGHLHVSTKFKLILSNRHRREHSL